MGVVLRVTSGPHSGEEFLIDRSDTITVGRSSRVGIPMTKDLLLSREHFQVESQPPLCHIVDLGSTNGTKVNGLRVERVVLREGDVITAGDSAFSVHYSDGAYDGDPLVTCAGCGARVPVETSENLGSVDDADPDLLKCWLCQECQVRKLKFPKTGPDYLIDEWIGGGGMGEVFRARQLSRNRPVAIKMISSSSQLGNKARGYFRREIEVLRDLLMPGGEGHPTIVAFYELFEVDAQFQLVMEYVDGKNALEWIKGLDRPLPIPSAALIGRRLLSALDYAHSKGYVHRDVKPSNLLIMGPAHRPRLKLTDFGLAKSFADHHGVATLTGLGDIGGSVGFISPDHILDFRQAREPADIYGAATTLFYLLTNRYPYLGFDPRDPASYQAIIENPAVPLRAFRPEAPEGFERILLKAMQKQPAKRWKSAAAMAEALRPYQFSNS